MTSLWHVTFSKEVTPKDFIRFYTELEALGCPVAMTQFGTLAQTPFVAIHVTDEKQYDLLSTMYQWEHVYNITMARDKTAAEMRGIDSDDSERNQKDIIGKKDVIGTQAGAQIITEPHPTKPPSPKPLPAAPVSASQSSYPAAPPGSQSNTSQCNTSQAPTNQSSTSQTGTVPQVPPPAARKQTRAGGTRRPRGKKRPESI